MHGLWYVLCGFIYMLLADPSVAGILLDHVLDVLLLGSTSDHRPICHWVDSASSGHLASRLPEFNYRR